ncbi:MAG: tetratricopeptide repeat protein [Myxococcota bacterium]
MARKSRRPKKSSQDGGFEAVAAEVRANPGLEEAWGRLEELTAETQQPEEASAIFREVLGQDLPHEVLSTVGQRAVQFHEEWFGDDSPLLVEVLSRLLEVDPSAAEDAFQRLTMMFTASERWEELLALYDKAIDSAPDEERRAALLDEASQSAKDFAHQPDRAIGYLERLLPLRPEDPQVAASLERLLEKQERFEDLIGFWRGRMDLMKPKEARNARLRIANLFLDRLGRPAEALQEARRLFEDPRADTSEAGELLERIVASEDAPVETRRDAFSLIKSRYEAEGRSGEVVRAIDSALTFADREMAVSLHREAGDLLAAQGEETRAMQHWSLVLQTDPGAEDARDRLRALAERTGDHQGLVSTFESAAESAEGPAARVSLWLESAEVRRQRLSDTEGAVALNLRVLSEPDVQPGAALTAARRLAELYDASGQQEERLGMLERVASLEPEQADRRAALGRAARLAEQLGQPDRALELWRSRMEADAGDREAVDAVVSLLEREERWEPLVEALRRRIAHETVAFARRADLVRVARIEAERLADPDRAIATWREVAEGFGEDPEVVDALSELYGQTERWQELTDLLERATAREGEHLAAVRVRMGDIYREQLGDPQKAVTSYRRTLEADPTHEAARAGLVALSEVEGVGAEAVEALAVAYRLTDEWQGTLSVLETRLRHAEPWRRIELLKEAARLQEHRAEDPAAALTSVRRALALAPMDRSFEDELFRLAEATGNWSEAAQGLREAADALEGEPLRVAHLRRREGDIQENRLGDPALAAAAYAASLDAEPATLDTAQALVRAAEAAGSPETAEAALQQAADAEGTGADHLRLLAGVQRRQPGRPLYDTLLRLAIEVDTDLDPLREAADLARGTLEDEALATRTIERLYEAAVRLWRRGERARGEHQPEEAAGWAVEQLLRAYEEAGDSRRVVNMLLEASRLPCTPEESRAYRRRAAEMAAEQLGDRRRAIDLLRDIVSETPDDAAAMDSLARLYEQERRVPELLSLRRHELGATESTERRLALRLEIARLFVEMETEYGRIESLKANLDEAPGHEASLESLESFLSVQGRYDELADVFTEQASRLEERGEVGRAAALYGKVARWAEDRLEDANRAIECHRKVVELAPAVASLDALARMHTEREEHALAARWLERRLAMASEEERADVALRLGRALLAAAKDERAVEVLEQAREAHPESTEVRDLLARKYREMQAWAPLARVLADATAHVRDEGEVLELVREVAGLYHDRLGTPEASVEVLERGVSIAPKDRPLRSMLGEALLAAGRHDEAREVLGELVKQFGRRRSAERAAAHHQLARVAHAQGDLDGAIEQLEQATKMDMSNPGMLRMLGRFAREAEQLDKAERAYRALLLVARRSAEDELEVGAAEVQWELHLIAQARGDEEQAVEMRQSALDTAVQSDVEAVRLARALVERGEGELALSTLDKRLEEVGEEAQSRATLLAEAADVLDGALGRAEEALERRLEALTLAPHRAALHEAGRALAVRLGQAARYVEVVSGLLDKRRRKDDAALQLDLRLRVAEAQEQDLEDLEGAAASLRQAEELGERLGEVWVALARVHAKRGDADEQRRVLEQVVATDEVGTDARTDAMYQLAALHLSDADRRDAGVEVLRRAFEADPRPDRAARVLEQAAKDDPTHDGVMALYEEVARSSGDDAMMLDYLEIRAGRPDAALKEIREGVERADALGEAERAERLLERAVAVAEAQEGGLAAARWILTGLAERRQAAGDMPGAARWMRQAAETATDEDEAFELTLKFAQMAEGEGGDLRVAAETYERLLERDPTDRRVWEPLLRCYRALGDEDRLNDQAATLMDALLDPGLRNAVRMEKARYLLGIEERQFDAVDILKDVLAEEPEHAEAGSLLADLYEKSGYDEDLVELLDRQFDAARDGGDPAQVAEVALRLGALLEKVRREDAIDVYQRALEVASEERRLVEQLLSILTPDDDPRLRIRATERLLSLESGERAAELARRLYTEWEQLGEEAGMQRALELGYRGCPEDADLRERLETWYRHHDDLQGLSAFLAKEAERQAEPEPGKAMAALLEAAAIRRDRLGDAGGAVEMLRRARELTPGDTSILGELAEALAMAGEPRTAVDEVTASIEQFPDDAETRTQLLRMRAGLWLQLGDPAQAVGDLEQAYVAAGTEVGADLADALGQQRAAAAGAGDRDAERAAALRLVAVLEETGDAAAAREVLAEWVQSEPEDREALARLRDMDLASERWDGVADTCGKLALIEEGEAQVEAALTMADACDKAGRPEDARPVLEHVAQAQPGQPRIVDKLREVYEKSGAHRELAELLLREAEQADEERRFELLRDVGRLYVAAGDSESAIPVLEELARIHPEDHETVLHLADAYTATERFQESGQLLENAINGHSRRRSPELAELQHRMAMLARAVGDRQLEMQWMNAALESDKNNGAVAANLATLAMDLGEYDVALNALRAVTLMKAEGPMSRAMAFLLQAKIAHQRGESRRALLWARKAKSEDPELQDAQQFLAELGEA